MACMLHELLKELVSYARAIRFTPPREKNQKNFNNSFEYCWQFYMFPKHNKDGPTLKRPCY